MIALTHVNVKPRTSADLSAHRLTYHTYVCASEHEHLTQAATFSAKTFGKTCRRSNLSGQGAVLEGIVYLQRARGCPVYLTFNNCARFALLHPCCPSCQSVTSMQTGFQATFNDDPGPTKPAV